MRNILKTISEYNKEAYEKQGKKEIIIKVAVLRLLLFLVLFMIIAFPVYSQPLSKMSALSVIFNFYFGVLNIKNAIPILIVLFGIGVIILEIKKQLSIYKRRFR